jgi:hypothetical protein
MGIIFSNNELLHERIIDATNFGNIKVGITESEEKSNPLSKQKIKFNNKISELKFFTKTESNLIYEFDDEITLKFYKNNEGDIIYNFNYPNLKINFTKHMDDIIIKWYDLINQNSSELDEIYNFIKKN